MNVQALKIPDPLYPALLKEIFDPPAVLYYVGDLDVLKKPACAVVGTRRCSSYGEGQAFRFGKELSQHGICVVSGLAYGVDAAAHKGALEGPGGTVAVLAQSLPDIQPAGHTSLARRIVENGGLLLCEKVAGAETFKSDYLIRNRIIAGLCKATLVVEAPFKSGARNTAKHAVENGRDVMALPGRITDEGSQGTNGLIQEGARLVVSPQEIGEVLEVPWERTDVVLEGLSKEIFQELRHVPQSPAELAEHFQGSLSELYAALGELELRGLIRFTRELRYAVCGGSAGTSG